MRYPTAIRWGGIVRDNHWARSITQPTIITSTIDQVGSRLLFRGYGVSEFARSLHAALVAHDSTILLDEAHISQPFVETLQAIEKYRGASWAHEPIRTPFVIAQMTATPGHADPDVFRLDVDDRKHRVLKNRHGRAKPVELHVATKAKEKNALTELAAELTAKAVDLQGDQCHNVAVVVNRVATARAVYEELPKLLHKRQRPESEVHLAIGRMRPLDRDEMTDAIQQRVGMSRKTPVSDDKPMFVVATQCLEVGADFDFDAMVCECASLDALRQRFGRLNRTGRDTEARGCIVIRADQVKTDEQLDDLDEQDEQDDPIYGNALARTWNWLQGNAQNKTLDFGVNAMVKRLKGVDIASLLAPCVHAPVMFPAYVDAWAQTSPAPAPDPDVSLFLHGPQRGEPDINACWRSDLPADADDSWSQIVSLCPPSSPECMPVPIGIVRTWLGGKTASDELRSDLLDAAAPEAKTEREDSPRVVLAWRGADRSTLIRDPADLCPGDTIVLPVAVGGWDVFGHIPSNAEKDLAEQAHRQSSGWVILRLRSDRIEGWPKSEEINQLNDWLRNPESDLRATEIRNLLQYAANVAPETHRHIADALRLLADKKNGLEFERYADQHGFILRTRKKIFASATITILPALDDGEDEPSHIDRETPIALAEHLKHVRHELEAVMKHLPLGNWCEALRHAADLHDWGKADERFQALLLDGDREDAWAQPNLWAKSARMPTSRAERRLARRRSGLPDGFRHEMLSVQLAQLADDVLPADESGRDLVLHLIASHHGRGRPFAPVVIDEQAPSVSLELGRHNIALSADQRKANPLHRLDSGIAERFWSLTRRFGWWGLAYMEAALRLADQRASQREEESPDADANSQQQTAEVMA